MNNNNTMETRNAFQQIGDCWKENPTVMWGSIIGMAATAAVGATVAGIAVHEYDKKKWTPVNPNAAKPAIEVNQQPQLQQVSQIPAQQPTQVFPEYAQAQIAYMEQQLQAMKNDYAAYVQQQVAATVPQEAPATQPQPTVATAPTAQPQPTVATAPTAQTQAVAQQVTVERVVGEVIPPQK